MSKFALCLIVRSDMSIVNRKPPAEFSGVLKRYYDYLHPFVKITVLFFQ